jgi:APA family basic amino acid/polyamine antiporter
MISIFAALNGSILSGSRVPYAMAPRRTFFKSVAKVHPEFRTPGISILAQRLVGDPWCFRGVTISHSPMLYLASWILYGMTAVVLVRYCVKRPEMRQACRTFGYPVIPIVFVMSAPCLVISTLFNSPRESPLGLSLVLVGLPSTTLGLGAGRDIGKEMLQRL